MWRCGLFCFFKQKTAYEMRISDWSSDVCSSDLAELGPHMLYLTNRDKPGVIGALGRTLGDAGVNIATFHLGRNESGGDAIALLQIDQPVDKSLLETIQKIPNVMQAKFLRF